MSLFDKIFGNKNPLKESQPYFDKAEGLYQPYQQMGLGAGQNYNQITGMLASDPAGYLNQLMQGYKMSDQAKLQQENALRASGAGAAAGGYRGTPSDLMNSANIAAVTQGQDMQNYLQNAQGLLGQGLQGQGNLYQGGLNAANSLGGLYGTQAGMAAQGAQQSNLQRNQLLQALAGLAGGTAGFFASGGNPMGAMAGASLASGQGAPAGMDKSWFTKS